MGTTQFKIQLAGEDLQRINLRNATSLNSIDVTTPVAHQPARITTDTCAGWAERITYIPRKGEIIVYSDRHVIEGVAYPGMKVGDGLAYVVDLPFVGDNVTNQIAEELSEHTGNEAAHVSAEDRVFWNRKLNYEVDGEELVLTRE